MRVLETIYWVCPSRIPVPSLEEILGVLPQCIQELNFYIIKQCSAAIIGEILVQHFLQNAYFFRRSADCPA